jgi:cell division septation protein DedD|tara:strand:+ start:84 stop:467 length:384 start_codon:yes stop_codon:yes gene_type:complete
MNLEKFVGLIFIILMGLIVFIFVLSPQPKYQDSISYQLAPNARALSKNDFEMYVVRVNVFENKENAEALKKNINNYFPAYTKVLQNNNDLTAVYVGPFRTKEDVDKNIEFIYEISETNSGEVILWQP